MSAAPLTVREANEADRDAWDAYVDGPSGASFFHLYGWRRVIEAAYGYRAVYLIAERADAVVGVLPMIDVRSELLGRSLISTAFTVGGGLAARDTEAGAALARAALEEGRRRQVNYVELRSDFGSLPDWETKQSVYAGFERQSPADERDHLAALPRRRRAEIRKGLAALEAGILDYDFGADTQTFYALYALAMRDHGTPVFPRRFVHALREVFAGRAEILQIRALGEPVLALLTFRHGERLLPYYFGASPAAREYRAYDLAIWLQMRRGVAQGAPTFDFGRSRIGSGSSDYKQYWGFEPRPLVYRYGLVRAKAAPNVNPDNPKFALASRVWRRLPLPVANAAGPILARHFA